jgi:hypothetical protein
MLREMMVGRQLHASLAGTASLPVLAEANPFSYKHFWLTVHFPAIAPGTPIWKHSPVGPGNPRELFGTDYMEET